MGYQFRTKEGKGQRALWGSAAGRAPKIRWKEDSSWAYTWANRNSFQGFLKPEGKKGQGQVQIVDSEKEMTNTKYSD